MNCSISPLNPSRWGHYPVLPLASDLNPAENVYMVAARFAGTLLCAALLFVLFSQSSRIDPFLTVAATGKTTPQFGVRRNNCLGQYRQNITTACSTLKIPDCKSIDSLPAAATRIIESRFQMCIKSKCKYDAFYSATKAVSCSVDSECMAYSENIMHVDNTGNIFKLSCAITALTPTDPEAQSWRNCLRTLVFNVTTRQDLGNLCDYQPNQHKYSPKQRENRYFYPKS